MYLLETQPLFYFIIITFKDHGHLFNINTTSNRPDTLKVQQKILF